MKEETPFLRDVFERAFEDEADFYYACAPFPSQPTASSEPTYTWWPTNGDAKYVQTFAHLSKILDQEGPFDGIVGFSQGGSVAALTAALLERPVAKRPANFTSMHEPLRFVISYSGYREDDARVQQYYSPSIKTPIQHFICSTDPIMAEERCLRLVQVCEDGDERAITYTGSGFHRVPRTRMTTSSLSRFLTDLQDM
jgi:dienelactone hydrolase